MLSQRFRSLSFYINYTDYAHCYNLSILKKVTAAAVAKAGPQKNEKTNSFKNIKFNIQIAFSVKMRRKPASKTKHQWGPP